MKNPRLSAPGRLVSLLSLLLGCLPAGVTAQPPATQPSQPSPASAKPNGSLLIADFAGGKLETISGLAWVVVADEHLGGTSTVLLTLKRPGAQGASAAMKIAFSLGEGFPYPFAGAWALPGSEGLPADLTAYRGLRFYARSPGRRVPGRRQAGRGPGGELHGADRRQAGVDPDRGALRQAAALPSRRGPPQPFVAKDVVSIGRRRRPCTR
jgi:hypothetical protein